MNSCFRKCIRKTFIEHPESVGESYITHGYKATMFGVKLIGYGMAELVHAIIPKIDIFEMVGTTSGEQLEILSNELKNRKNHTIDNKAD